MPDFMKQSGQPGQKRSLQAGYTLIEVLIAALVLSVGVLGIAGLQITSLKNLQTSNHIGIAAMLANGIADRMWVNQGQVLANAYVHTAGPGSPPDCVASTCSPTQMASFDVNDWQQQITGYTRTGGTAIPALLPSGSGAIAQVGTTRSYRITLRWDDDRSGSTGTTCPPAAATDLDCYTMTVTF
ncbi:type IV pilus modification protein PilV [Halieaceae bacterium IMCC14734]|uniref:Type IV pilus modification protein PilV n=1 Tax=Candidatus Litorirhabdus singularis TaxID=2518993 RepID=A0ABT3TPE6_9GAMM|nr:type IV pilus modification protein PilV [Candidatus Litorirhabdus singularis]MCX2983207.1 type IV pilus modification protein PilV [Candidatus Litorirhabdus singularis]